MRLEVELPGCKKRTEIVSPRLQSIVFGLLSSNASEVRDTCASRESRSLRAEEPLGPPEPQPLRFAKHIPDQSSSIAQIL